MPIYHTHVIEYMTKNYSVELRNNHNPDNNGIHKVDHTNLLHVLAIYIDVGDEIRIKRLE